MATTKITVSPPSAGGSYGSRNEKAPFSRGGLQASEAEEGVGSEAGSKSASPEETSHKKEKLMVNDSACELSPCS